LPTIKGHEMKEATMNTMLAVEVESLPNAYNDGIDRAVLYVLCDPKLKPIPGIMITGVGLDVSGRSDRWPFVILKDGRGDHGKDFNSPLERFFETNFRSKTMKPLELFTVRSPDPEQPARQIETTFRVRNTTVLAGPKSKLN
jgi:hypothetical protein